MQTKIGEFRGAPVSADEWDWSDKDMGAVWRLPALEEMAHRVAKTYFGYIAEMFHAHKEMAGYADWDIEIQYAKPSARDARDAEGKKRR